MADPREADGEIRRGARFAPPPLTTHEIDVTRTKGAGPAHQAQSRLLGWCVAVALLAGALAFLWG